MEKKPDFKKMSFMELCRFIGEEVEKYPKVSKVGLTVDFPYDLRESLDMKTKNCSMYHKWTAFLNNAGNLCHVVSADAEILIRIKFTYPIKHLSKACQIQMVLGRIKHWVKV